MFLKRCLLAFWAIWFSIVCATNVVDLLNGSNILVPPWRFASGNWDFVQLTTARYQPPPWLNLVLFAGVIAWEGLAALLFALAWLIARGRVSAAQASYPAFVVSLPLWAAFMIADEICIAYQVEATHLRIFIALLATLLVIQLVPERRSPG